MEMSDFDAQALAEYYAYFPQPPYLIVAFGFVSAVLCGLAFQGVLKELLREWQQQQSTRTLNEMRGWRLLTPYLGIGAGSVFFLAAGVEIFGVPTKFAYGLATVMAVLVGRLIWWQLSKVLDQLEEGGSAALDLDSFY
jgi:NhaP-type Na+/H+ or K+/H+ antiporter